MTPLPPRVPSHPCPPRGTDGNGAVASPLSSARHLDSSQRAAGGRAAQSRIFCEEGDGRIPTIVVAGFLPDATESIEYQRELLTRHGDIYYVNYPRDSFSTEALFNQISDLIRDVNGRGEAPVIFSMCFGSGLVAKFLREASDAARVLHIAGLVMVSPVLCAADMARLDGEEPRVGPLRERAARMFFLADTHADIEWGVARARRAFTSLFRRERATRLLNDRNVAIITKVMAAVREITVDGYYERALALKALTWPAVRDPLFRGPALLLFAEHEDGVFVPTSPTLAAFRTPDGAARLFPQAAVHEVGSANAEDPVTHGSIVVHHRYFNPFITAWYQRLSSSNSPQN
jgi:hypothetical protein